MITLSKKVAAQAQQKVALVDISQDILNKAEKRISESLKWVHACNIHDPLRLNKYDNIDDWCAGESRRKSSKTTRKLEKFSPPLQWPTSLLPPGTNSLL